MNEEEKKAIEILDTFELRRKTKNYKEISLEDSQSVKIILNLIKRLQKENEEWQKAYQEEKDKQFKLIREKQELEEKWNNDTHKLQNDLDIANAKIIELKEENEQLEAIKDEAIRKYNFETIPVEKVKDKIKELEDYIQENSDEQGYWGNIKPTWLCVKITALQELIEEREKK